MKFSKICSEFLSTNLNINIQEFESILEDKFNDNAQHFDELVYFMIHDSSRHKLALQEPNDQLIEFKEFTKRYLDHISNKCYLDETLLGYAYEIICYFGWFYSGGLVELFKHRQAENKGPRIYLSSPLTEQTVLELHLPEDIVAYRGMSVTEYESGLFGMSWSLSEETAIKFAFYTYHDEPRGVVVKANITRSKVLYYSPTDSEQEIVVANQTISCGDITQR